MSGADAWVTLALLGAFHGLNPAMGWLFAVALGLQHGSRWSVARALPPIALGHAASVAVILTAVLVAQRVVPLAALRLVGGGVIVLAGVLVLVRRAPHARWVGMRVGFRELALWSFLTSAAHGAGLMLVPLALRPPHAAGPGALHATAGHPHAAAAHLGAAAGAPVSGGASPAAAALAIAVHTLAMLAVMAAVALVVYEVVGLAFLRRAWINLDLVWGVALVGAGVLTLVL